jgi:hypothetical protein
MNFREAWQQAPTPTQLRSIRKIHFEDFAELVKDQEDFFVQHFVESVSAGDAFILKGAFPAHFIESLKNKVTAWKKTKPSEFHKMLDGCPDFHRVIDEEVGKKYSIKAIKHSSYFFRWNDDPLGIWPEITKRWRVLKQAMGMYATEYEDNKPSDGPTDRIQVVRYPPAIGYLEPHRDAAEHQPCFISGYMSKRGTDYEGGGFYFVVDGKAVYAEDMIDVGDLCIGHANIMHGVAPCDRGKPSSWDATDGRWFLGLYSNASDYEKKRNTAKPVSVEVEGVLP